MVKETDSDTIAALNSEAISLKQEETEIADHVCSAFILPVFSQVAFTSLSINYHQNLWALYYLFFMECCYQVISVFIWRTNCTTVGSHQELHLDTNGSQGTFA